MAPRVQMMLSTALPHGCWREGLCFFKELIKETPLQKLAALASADHLLITDSDLNVTALSNLSVS